MAVVVVVAVAVVIVVVVVAGAPWSLLETELNEHFNELSPVACCDDESTTG